LQKKCFDAHNAELHVHFLDQQRLDALSQPERAALRSASSGAGLCSACWAVAIAIW
jgi:hypothetical protein